VSRALAAAVVLSLAVPADATADQDNEVAWMLNCQGCHRADGTATGDQVPALKGTVARFLSVPGGREYLIRVPGVSMAPLNDESIAALTNWMLHEFDRDNIPADFERYTADEVGGLRHNPYSSEASVVRAGLIEEIEQATSMNTGEKR
jgi:hypothetical protein